MRGKESAILKLLLLLSVAVGISLSIAPAKTSPEENYC